jgi:pimeloyl-ACP methyl ester carboxylesterase
MSAPAASSALEHGMPKVAYLETDTVRLAYYEVGPRKGVPVIFCHGFPELAFSWRHQLRAFEAAGLWAIAPDQRGYGLTSRPDAVEAYDMEALTGDLVALLDHLGVEKAVFCGHDWGGAVVWQMPLRHPDRVAGVIGVNTPFTPRAPADPIAIMRQRFGEDMYIVNFQKPGEADAILAADVAKTMSFFLRRPPAGMAPPSGGISSGGKGDGGGDKAPAPTFALLKALQAWDPAADPRESFLSPDEMAVFVENFQRTGFTGGINWYRNITRNWQRSPALIDRVTAPSLMVMAELDAVLPPSAADGMAAFIPDLEKVLIEGSGHWTQQERPDRLNAVIMEWITRRFCM